VVSALLEEGHAVSALVRRTSKADFLRKQNVRLVCGDITDSASLDAIQGTFDAIVHSAAYVADRDWDRLYRTNVTGTENICKLALRLGVDRLVYMSSVAVVSANPQVPLTDDLPYAASNLYGRSKIEAEKIVVAYRQKGLRSAVLRPSMVYGEGEPHLLGTIIFLLRWRLLPIPNEGKNTWHLSYVRTVADAVALALRNDEALHGAFFVADREVLTAGQVLSVLAEVIGAARPFVLSKTLTSALVSIPYVGRKLSLFLKDRVYDVGRLQRMGLQPRLSAQEALRRTAASYR
jgi:nucleoside-diphosphate-sugar epimerase